MIESSVSIYPAAPATPAAPPGKPAETGFAHQLLSELNPLQYVPVIGTIYRAVTGDTIPEAARLTGSLIFSGLTGGPIGLAINAGVTLFEHLAGIDPEQIGSDILSSLGVASSSPDPPAKASPPPAEAAAQEPAPATGWSAEQLRAYGITLTRQGEVSLGTQSGADVLNGLELSRITPS